jgi:tRNA A37 methylthiotransferase MiaB
MIMGKAHIISTCLTCKGNTVLSNRLADYCAANGYALVREARQADIVLINTCGFTLLAQQEAEACLKNVVESATPQALICAVGCMVKLKGEELARKYPRVHMVNDLSRLDGLLKAQRSFDASTHYHYEKSVYGKVARAYNWGAFKEILSARMAKAFQRPGGLLSKLNKEVLGEDKIFIQIGTGCLNQCSYCSIRRAKGSPVSRPIADIVAELKTVYRPGLSVNWVCDEGGSYGYDIGTDLLSLLYAVDKEYPGIPMEISYLHPRWLVRDEAAYFAAFGKLNIAAMNVPIQSGSNRVLSVMKRMHKIEDVLRIFREIKRISPGTFLWGDIIYGHPSEKPADFHETLRAVWSYDHFIFTRMSPVNESDIGPCDRRNIVRLSFHGALLKVAQDLMFGRLVWRDWRGYKRAA